MSKQNSPRQKQALTIDEIAYLANGDDNFSYNHYHNRDFVMPRASAIERLIIWLVLLIVAVALYIHLDITPFLPFTFTPQTAEWLTIGAFAVMASCLVRLLWFFVLMGATHVRRKLLPAQPRIACRGCGKRVLAHKYLEAEHCPHCAEGQVYCAKCGKPSNISDFTSGAGCAHCHHNQISVQWS